MGVRTAALASAVVATGLAGVGHAAYPAQFVLAAAAGCSFLAVLGKRHRASAADWLIVRLLLAGNLSVSGIDGGDQLGAPLAAFVIVSGTLLAADATYTYATRRRRPRRQDR
jgi:hypothetical protein